MLDFTNRHYDDDRRKNNEKMINIISDNCWAHSYSIEIIPLDSNRSRHFLGNTKMIDYYSQNLRLLIKKKIIVSPKKFIVPLTKCEICILFLISCLTKLVNVKK